MIWLIGSNGMLGQEIARQLDKNNISWIGSNSDVDITNSQALDSFALSHDIDAGRTGNAIEKGFIPQKITWVINCAAYTKVDQAESEEELAKAVNAEGAKNVARATRKIGAKLIHISTDYVYDGLGKTPYTEGMAVNPISVYGKTKLAGEEAVQKEMTKYYIIRTSWLYGSKGPSFVNKIAKAMNEKEELSIVNDQWGTPTCAMDLAQAIIKIIKTSDNAQSLFGKKAAIPYGIYNYSNMGEITWFDFAAKIYDLGKKYSKITNNCILKPCTTQDYPTAAKRPQYSVLSKDKITSSLKIKIPKWDESLEKFIKSNNFSI